MAAASPVARETAPCEILPPTHFPSTQDEIVPPFNNLSLVSSAQDDFDPPLGGNTSAEAVASSSILDVILVSETTPSDTSNEDQLMTTDEFFAWWSDTLTELTFEACQVTADTELVVGFLKDPQLYMRLDWKAEPQCVRLMLKCASLTGSIPALRYLHGQGFDLSKYLDEGLPVVVSCAISAVQPEVLKWLREIGVDLLWCGSTLTSNPMVFAVLCGQLDILKYLVEIGGNLKVVLENKQNLAHMAASSRFFPNKPDRPVKSDSSNASSSTQIGSTTSRNPEREIIIPNLPNAPCYGRDQLEIIQWLHEQGVDYKAPRGDGTTIVHLAARTGNLVVLHWLYSQGLNFRKRSVRGESVAYYASMNQQLEILEWLDAMLGWNFEQDRTDDGSTLAHAVAANLYGADRTLEVLKYLHSRGVSMKTRRKVATSPTVLSLVPVCLDTLQWLHSVGVDVKSACTSTTSRVCPTIPENATTVLSEAAGKGQLEVLKWLHSLGVNLKTDSSPISLSSRAAHCGALEMLKWLHSEGLDVIGICTDKKPPSLACGSFAHFDRPGGRYLAPPFMAAATGHIDIVEWYVDELGVDINVMDTKTSTSFVAIAVSCGQLPMLQWLAKRNVNPTEFEIMSLQGGGILPKVDKAKSIPLALLNGKAEVFEWLCEYDPTYMDRPHAVEMVIDIASTRQYDRILEWLVTKGYISSLEQIPAGLVCEQWNTGLTEHHRFSLTPETARQYAALGFPPYFGDYIGGLANRQNYKDQLQRKRSKRRK